jgi:hypothetical protein
MINKSRKNRKLIYLFLIFVIPLLIGNLLYYYHQNFNFKTTNHGTLVSPPINIQALQLIPDKKWRIVYFPDKCFDEDCKKTAYTLHQVKIALGKESRRVEVLVITDVNQISFLQKLINKNNFAIQDKIYLIDPINNLFMYYPANVNPMFILKDMKKVLEVSQIG